MENHTSEIGGHRAGCHCETCFQLRSVVEKTATGVEELTGCLDVGRVEIKDATIELMGSTRSQDAPVIDAAGKVPSGMPLTVRVDVTANSMVDSGAIASHVAKFMDSVAKRGKDKLAASTVPELKPTAFGGAADWAAAIHALHTPSLVRQLARRRLGDNYTEAQLHEFLTGMPQMHMGGMVYPSQKSFSQQKLDHLRDAILPSSRTRSSQSTSQSTTDHEAIKVKVRDAELAFDALIREVLLSTTDHDRSIKRLRARHADMIEEICEMKGFYL